MYPRIARSALFLPAIRRSFPTYRGTCARLYRTLEALVLVLCSKFHNVSNGTGWRSVLPRRLMDVGGRASGYPPGIPVLWPGSRIAVRPVSPASKALALHTNESRQLSPSFDFGLARPLSCILENFLPWRSVDSQCEKEQIENASTGSINA